MSDTDSVRLFFALWPNNAIRVSIASAASKVRVSDARWVPEENLHVTLAFLGQVCAQQRLAVIQSAKCLSAQAFPLQLTHIESWKKPQLLCLCTDEIPASLLLLQQALQLSLLNCGFELEKRPFKPHITLARRSPRISRQLLSCPIEWQVDRISLILSDTTGVTSKYTEIWHRSLE